jgi:hypothetical protein
MGNSLGYDEEDTKKLYQNLTSMPSEAFDELKQYYDLNYEQHSLHQQQKTLDNNIIVDIETEKSLASNTPIENKRTDFDSLKKNEKAFINQLDNIYDNINLFLEHGADSDTKKDIFQKKLKSLAIGKSLFIPIMLKNEQDEPEMSIIEIYRMKQNPYNTQKDNENYVMSLHSTQHFKLNMEDQNYIPRLLINKKTSGDRSPMKNIKFMMYDLIDQENRQVPLTRGEVLLNDKIVKIQIPEIFAENLAIDFDKNKQLPIINTIIKDDFYHPIPKLTKENDYNSYNAVQNSVIKANAIHFDCEDFVQQLSQQKI